MKNTLKTLIAAVGFVIFTFAVTGAAQTAGRVVANIPFDFYVGEKLMPKGSYEFRPASRQSSTGSLSIRSLSESTGSTVMIQVMSASYPKQDDDGISVAFTRYGATYYLAGISAEAAGLSLRIVPTTDEKRLAREFDRADLVRVRPGYTPAN